MNNHSSMILTRNSLSAIDGNKIELPEQRIFDLPEKVLQFGTGVFIRSFADYFIDKANKKGSFNGRIVVVKSTDNGDGNEFRQQDGLYTVCCKGLENGQLKEEFVVNASISRMLTANSQWREILDCAGNPEMKIVISNTTEIGIQLVEEVITDKVPVSFPGKLLSFLMERFRVFGGTKESGMVIIPAELIPDNGSKLKEIILALARYNNAEEQLLSWLDNHNKFCNSLVDRIVSGKPAEAELQNMQTRLGYTDRLLSVSELFSLWAIEGNESVREVLCFSKENKGVVIRENIDLYRELKLRLLNGTHTFNCGLAFLSGIRLTRDAMNHPEYGTFARNLMTEDIASAIPIAIDDDLKNQYAHEVIERFCNPFIDHQWISITAQYTSKMKMRNIPLILKYDELFVMPSERMAAGFAGYLLFMKAVKSENGKYSGLANGSYYPISDDHAEYFFRLWENNTPDEVVKACLSNKELWGSDLTALSGFEHAVAEKLKNMIEYGVMTTLNRIENIKV